MNVSKEKKLCGWHMAKSLSATIMGVWSQSPEQGWVKRLERLARTSQANGDGNGVGVLSATQITLKK